MKSTTSIVLRCAPASLLACLAISAPALAANPYENNLAKTPPMGWNSWNCCGGSNEAQVKAIADAMVSSGMKDAGYQYVVIDDGWATARDGQGTIGVNSTLFPSGIAALAAYVHSRGLKFGIYTSRGRTTCAGLPGSAGYEARDAQQYAAWGVDFVKADGCGDGQQPTRVIAEALTATGRPIVLSTNEWSYSPGLDTVANMWRISDDIHENWPRIMWILDLAVPLWPVARPGHWNDPDMLEVGNGATLTLTENKSHFALWCMLAAPLMAGNDLTAMRPEIRDILVHSELIAIDQDSLGRQARRVRKTDSLEVWVKVLKDSSRAVALLNRGPATARIGFSLATIGIQKGIVCRIRDVWKKADIGSIADTFSDTVPSHGTGVYRVFKGADNVGPRILNAFTDTTLSRVCVLFDEPLDPATAGNAAGFALDNGATVSSATPAPGGAMVILATSGLVSGTAYGLTAQGVRDQAGNAVAQGARAEFVAQAHATRKLSGTVIGSGAPFNGDAAVSYNAAIDGNLSTYSDLTPVGYWPIYVGYRLPAPAMITGAAYAPRSSLFADRMVGMQVQGSDDSVGWTTLCTIAATPAVGSLTRQTVAAGAPCRYVRLEGTAGFLNVAEVEFYGYETGSATVRAPTRAPRAAAPLREQPVLELTIDKPMTPDREAAVRRFDLRGARMAHARRPAATAVTVLIVRRAVNAVR